MCFVTKPERDTDHDLLSVCLELSDGNALQFVSALGIHPPTMGVCGNMKMKRPDMFSGSV